MLRLEEISKLIIDEIHSVIPELNEQSISMDKGFMEMGVESLQAVTIIGNLSQRLNVHLDMTALFDRPNLESLSKYIYEILNKKTENPAVKEENVGSFEKEKISIIGMSCRFPGAANLEEFYNLLKEKRDAIKKHKPERWKSSADDSINYFGAIENFDEFCPDVFGITDMEAQAMDPQQRLLLEQTWLAIEDSGLSPLDLKSQQVGVYIGISSHDYSDLIQSVGANIFKITGNSQSIAANRISYIYDFKGPSLSIDTACSSSLVALDAAVKDLQLHEVDYAIVGGVNLLLNSQLSTAFKEATMLSPDGQCKTFSDQANGYVRGEGVGVIVLRRQSLAHKDSQRIYANVLATAVNQDGKSTTLTAPNGIAQEQVLKKALKKANLNPSDIVFHEAHGTGTSLGDPIEALALQRTHQDRLKEDSLRISSVKTNIGHLEAAAGVAGIIKSALQVYHKKLFPSLHFTNWNKLLEGKVPQLQVQTQLEIWNSSKTLIGSISSFGFGGTNAQAILAEDDSVQPALESKNNRLFDYIYGSLQSNDKQTLLDQVKELQTSKEPSLKIRNSLRQMQSLEQKLFFFATSADNLQEVLKDIAFEKINSQYFYSNKNKKTKKVALLFTGQGSQYPQMYKELYNNYAPFRATVDRLILKAQKYFSQNLYSVWSSDISETNHAQILLFILEYSFFLILKNQAQIKFEYVFGHSLGEITAAAAAGYLSEEESIRLVSLRGNLMQKTDSGAMTVVFADLLRLEALLIKNNLSLDLAANNGPEMQVYSGNTEDIDKWEKILAIGKIRFQRMSVKQAFHSRYMEVIIDNFKSGIADLKSSASEVKLISSLTGAEMTSDYLTPAYWAEQIRKPTQFERSMKQLAEVGVDLFIEIGPKSVLTGMAQRFVNSERTEWISFIDPKTSNKDSFVRGLLKAYSLGVVSPQILEESQNNYQIIKTKFLKKKYWLGRGIIMENKNTNQSEKILTKLVEIMAATMRVSASEVQVDESLIDMGADSLVLLNAVQVIKDTYHVAIPIAEVFKDLNTLRKIAEYITQQVASESPVEAKSNDKQTNVTHTSVSLPLNAPAASPIMNSQASSDVVALLNNQLLLMQNQIQLLSQNGITSVASPTSISSNVATSEMKNDKELESLEKEKRGVLGNFKSFATKEKTDEDSQTKKEFLNRTIQSVNQLTNKTKTHVQNYRQYLADNRVSAGFRPNTKEMIYPIHCVKAKGSEFYDLDGNKFLDFTMGFGVNLFGHSPDFINEELKQQLELGMCVGPQSPVAGEVAKLFCELTGHERVAFVNSGTEAVMTAIRLARAASKKSKIVIFDGSYHGHFDGVLAKGTKNITSMPVAAGITQNTVNDVIVLEYGNEKSLDIIQEKISELAAVIVEPVQSRFPELQPKEFLKKLRKITEQNQVAFIWDEVITGFRIATGGAQEHFGIKADLASYGKVLGGGMPIGAVGGSKKYMDFIDGGFWKFGDESMPENEMTFFAGTFCKHPLAMASSLATLKKVKSEGKEIISQLNTTTNELTLKLNQVFNDLGVDIVAYNFGTLFRFKGSVNLDLLFTKLIEKGIYIWEGRNCFVSTAHTQEQLSRFVNAVKESTIELIQNKFYSSQKKIITYQDNKEIKKTDLIPAQKRFITIELHDQISHRANNICVSAKVKGLLDVSKLQQALEFITTKRDIFRWCLDKENQQQYFTDKVKAIDFEFINLRSINRPWKILDNHLLEISKTQFDLKVQAPMAIKIFDVVEETHLMAVVAHHLAFDGWSMTLFFEDLASVYNLLLEGKQPELRNSLPYEEYLKSSASLDKKAEETLLHKYVGSQKSLLFENKNMTSYEGQRIVFDVELKVYEALKRWCKINKYTPFMLLFAAFAKVLMTKMQKTTLTIGIPAANRDIPGSEVMYGNCANLVPLTLTLKEEPILSFVAQVKEKMIEGYQTMTHPYELLKDKTGPLFDVYFNLEPTSDLPEFNEASLLIHPFNISSSEFALMLNVTDFENYYHCEMDFQKSLINDDLVLEIIEQLRRSLKVELLQSVVQAKT